MPMLTAPAVLSKWDKKWTSKSFSNKGAETPGLLAHLSKWETNHKKLFIPWIQKKVDQEDCIGIVAKILRHKKNYVTFLGYFFNNEICMHVCIAVSNFEILMSI